MRHSRLRTVFLLLAVWFGLAALARWDGYRIPLGDLSLAGWLLLGVTVPPLTWAATLVQHFGRCVVGFFCGFSILAFRAGPLLVDGTSRPWTLRWEWRRLFSGGTILARPPCWDDSRRDDLRWRIVVYQFGGPLASAGASLMLLLWPESPGVFVFSALNFLNVPLAFFPPGEPGLRSPGTDIGCLLRGGPAAERLTLLYALSAHLVGSQRFADAPPPWIERLRHFVDVSSDGVSCAYYLYVYECDAGRLDAAAPHIEFCETHRQQWPADSRIAIELEALYARACFGRSTRDDASWLEAVSPSLFADPETIARVRAALLPPAAAIPLLREAIQAAQRRRASALEIAWLERDLAKREGNLKS